MSPLLKKTSFDSSKCVSLLAVTLQRIKILRNKRSIIAKQSRDDVAKLLQKGQDANAAARVEHAFREANIAGAYDLLEQYCELIIKNIRVVKSEKECPPDLKEAIASLIYAAPRCGDLQELQKLRDILTPKCGAELSAAALEQKPEGSVNQQIIQKLSGRPPNSDTRLNLLKEIAQEYKINWDYQKFVAASFKNGETSVQDKPVSKSPSQVSQGAVSTDVANGKPPAPASMHHQEQANASAHIATPPKSTNVNSEPRDFVRANQASNVARQPPVADRHKAPFDSLHRDGGHKSHASAAAQNTSPSTTHSSSPNPRDFVGASKKPIVGSPTAIDKVTPHDIPKHQVSSKEKESLQANADAIPSAMHRATPRQKECMGANQMSEIGLQPSAMYAHRDELKGQPSNANPSRNSNSLYEEKGFASPSHVGTLKPASVVTHPDGLVERASSAGPSTADDKVSRPKAFVNPIQVPDVSKPKSSERRKSELDRPMVQATSTQGIFQGTPSILHHETNNGNAESLAGKHYMRAHKNYIAADTGGEEEDCRSMENSGVNMRPKHGTHSPHVDPYVRPRHEGVMDYKKVSHSYEHVQEPKRTPRAMDGEEDTSSYEYYSREQPKGTQYHAREQPKGAHYQRASNASSHEGVWSGKSAFSSQDRHQAEENYHRDPATLRPLAKGHASRPSAYSELDDDIADLEAAAESAFVSAARAADAAKAAIDMVRTSSMRLRADKKVGDARASQREPYAKTSLNARNIHPSTHAEMLSVDTEIRVAPRVQKKTALASTHDLEHDTVLYDTSIRKKEEPFNHNKIRNEQRKQENNKMYTEAHQEQEPVYFDSEMPQFDDYSSYESSEEEPPFYAKGRAAMAWKHDAHENKKAAPNTRNQLMSPFVEQGGQGNYVNEIAHASVKKHSQQDPSGNLDDNDDDDDCAESVEFLSPKSSCSSNQHSVFSSDVQHSHKPWYDEYEQADNAHASHVSGVNTRNTHGGMATHHREQQGATSSASNEYVDNGALRWGASAPGGPTRDVSKQRWNLRATEEVNAQLHIRASQHDYPPSMATQDSQQATGKYFGKSRRSVRSSRPT